MLGPSFNLQIFYEVRHESFRIRDLNPSTLDVMEDLEFPSLCHLFRNLVENQPTKAGLYFKENGQWKNHTWKDFTTYVEKVANALRFLGLKKGDRIALISENRPEWLFVDMGVLHVGGLNVAIYPSSTPSQIAYIVNDSEARTVFVSNQEQLEKVITIAKDVPSLETLIYFDGNLLDSNKISSLKIYQWEDFLKESENFKGEELKNIWNPLTPEDLATLIYTSGTTGNPKGVMLSHGNLVSNALACRDHMPADNNVEGDPINFSFLPLCHALERMAGYYYPLSVGMPIAFAEALDKIVANLAEIKPSRFIAVPRVLEKIYNKVLDQVEKAGGLRKTLFYWALKVGKNYRHRVHKSLFISLLLKFQYQLAEKLVLKKLKTLMGGRIRLIIAGGAPLAPEIGSFFDAFGIYVLQGYGLTETSPVCTVNLPDNYRFDSVGVALSGVQIKIADDGEIMIKGSHVMKGYYKLPEKTKEVFTEDGWFLTGDIGELDSDGHLKITDRKKDLIVTAGGKNISPQNIENKLKLDPYIEQVCVIGDKRKYLSSLIVPNLENLQAYANENGIPFKNNEELVKNRKIYKLLQKSIDQVNQELASFENIRKFALLPREFSEAKGEITPTMKVRRKVIQKKYTELIEKMY